MAKDNIMEEIKKTLREVAESQKMADKHLKKIDKEIDKLIMSQKKTDEQIKKTDEQLKKTDEQIKKTDKELKETIKKTDEQLKKTDEQLKKTDEQLKKTDEQLKKTDEQLKKTDEQLKRTDEQVMKTSKKVDNLAELVGKLTNGWGKFVEGIVEPSCIKLADSLGIKVKKIHRRIDAFSGDDKIEADILIVGSSGKKDSKGSILVVEAKSHFEPDDMQYFLGWFVRFFEFFDEYKGYEVMGVVASPRFGNGVEKYAQRQGLWVLSASGDMMKLLNDLEKFKPKILSFSG